VDRHAQIHILRTRRSSMFCSSIRRLFYKRSPSPRLWDLSGPLCLFSTYFPKRPPKFPELRRAFFSPIQNFSSSTSSSPTHSSFSNGATKYMWISMPRNLENAKIKHVLFINQAFISALHRLGSGICQALLPSEKASSFSVLRRGFSSPSRSSARQHLQVQLTLPSSTMAPK
jgi:hypothetical protein